MNYSNVPSQFDCVDVPSRKSSRPFNNSEVKEMLEQLVDQNVGRQTEYDCNRYTQLSKDLSRTIKDAMKTMDYDRYKFVVQVVLGQCDNDNLMMACRCLWDVHTDSYASHVYSNRKIFCAVTVFALLYS
jgi:tctex1 domain-containing protein 2